LGSLKTFRRDAAPEFGTFGVYTTTSPSISATTLISTALIGAGFPSTALSQMWAYGTGTSTIAGQQRLVRATNPLQTSTGTLNVTDGFSVNPPSGAEFEILGAIPAVQGLAEPGWREILNACLKDIPLMRRLPIIPINGQLTYSINNSYPWLETSDQVAYLEDALINTDVPTYSPRLRDVRVDAESITFTLWTGYAGNELPHLVVFQPASTRIKTAGAWADSTVGLVSDDDESPAPRPLVKAMALGRAYRWLSTRSPANQATEWLARAREWEDTAARLKRQMMPKGDRLLRLDSAAVLSAWPKGLFP
jgi:hypothetical protein